MFHFRASTRTTAVVAAGAALVLCLFATSASAGYGGEKGGSHGEKGGSHGEKGGSHGEKGGRPCKKRGDYGKTEIPETDQNQPVPPPASTQMQPTPPQPASAVAPQAVVPAPIVAPAAAPLAESESAPAIEVKGETGTRSGNTSGGATGPVLAQASEVTAPSNGTLARTGFDLISVAILGGIFLGGSGLFFWRSRPN